MESKNRMDCRWTKTMRWIARALTILASGLFAWFLVESGARMFTTLAWGEPQGVPLLIALLAALVGALAAWRWELVGGIVAIAGALIIVGLVVWGSGVDMLYSAVWFTAPLLVAGGLYLACCARTRSATIAT